jgi:phosphatidylethanolamine/phosphatidyl-N-methylethanolamine N-methyltransferase
MSPNLFVLPQLLNRSTNGSQTVSVTYDLAGQKKAYAKWAAFYDYVYLQLLADSQKKLAAAASACGSEILEVGVGTGLVLRYYPPTARVVGVDLSEPMLQKAVEKVSGQQLSQVRGLAAMDACRLGFADQRFDAVAFPFVITLVPDPEGALNEAARVLRPGGEIVIASKLGADSGVQAEVEAWIAPVVKAIGWSSTFKYSRLQAWAKARGDFTVSEPEDCFPIGFFKLVRLKKAG